MEELLHIPLRYRDKHRAWQELVTAVQSDEGALLVPTQARADKRQPVRVTVDVDYERVLDFIAHVRKIRRPTPRFARGLFLELAPEVKEQIRARLSELKDAAAAGAIRRDRRFELQWPVRFRTPALLSPVRTLDISADGMHVEMPERVHAGDILELFLETPQGHEIGLVGQVQWASEVSPRIGLRFDHLDEDTREMFRLLLEWGVALAGEGRVSLPTMLVVGPEGETRDALGVLIQTWGSRVNFIEGAEEALLAIRRHRPSLVLVRAAADSAWLCRAVADDAELKATSVAVFGDGEPAAIDALAKDIGAHAGLALPATAGGVFDLLHRLTGAED